MSQFDNGEYDWRKEDAEYEARMEAAEAKRPRLISCTDRMCGAMDCPRCRGADAYAYLMELEEEEE